LAILGCLSQFRSPAVSLQNELIKRSKMFLFFVFCSDAGRYF